MSDEMKSAVIYTRVSTTEQAEGGTSLGTQEQACRNWCESRGVTVGAVFSDAGESAKTADRPQLVELMAWCSSHKPDICIVWKFDRWARNSTDHAVAAAALAKHGTRLVSATEAAADDPAGRLLQTILAGIAQFDNEVRAERTKAAMRSIAMRGGWCHKPPIGYLPAHSGPLPILVEDPELGPVVREMFEGLASGRRTLHQTCIFGVEHNLNDCSIRKLLKYPIYGGVIRNSLTGYRRVEAAFPPLVPHEVWEAAQDVISGKRRSAYVKHRDDMPLRGILACSECGQLLSSGYSRGRSKRYGYYQCKNGHVRVRIEKAHESWFELLERSGGEYAELLRQFRPEVRERIEERQEAALTVKKDAVAELRRLEQRRARLLDAFLNGVLSQDVFATKDEELRAKIERAEAASQAAFTWSINIDDMFARMVQMLADPVAIWQKLSTEQRHRFAISLFGSVIVIDNNGKCRTAANGGIAGALMPLAIPHNHLAPLPHDGLNLTDVICAVQAFFDCAA